MTTWIIHNYGWLLVLSFFLLITTKTLYNVPLLLMALLGTFRLRTRGRELMNEPRARLMIALFLCVWLPIIFSLPDAIVLQRSLTTTLRYLIFPLAGLFILTELQDSRARKRLFIGVVATLGFWSMDGLWQLYTGHDIFGYPYNGSQLTGAFHPKHRLGTALAAFSPLYFEGVRCLIRHRRLAWGLLVPLILAILASGNRNAWMVAMLSGGTYLVYMFWIGWLRVEHPKLLVATTLISVVAVVGFAVTAPALENRIKSSLGLLSLDAGTFDVASGRRLTIWGTALAMAQGNWLNGVGPRGFRYMYERYASQDDFWLMQTPGPPTHPHQMFLEVATETGVPGLIGFLAFGYLLLRAFRGLALHQRREVFPWALTVALTMLPLNMHMAFYSTYWSSITWWTVLVTVAWLPRLTTSASAHQA